MMQATLLDTGELARAIEAVLFVASESLSIKTLAKLTGGQEAEVTLALQQIDADYAARGIVLREVAGGYRFATAPAVRTVVEGYLMPPKSNLSPAALETLAVVAYLQPVTKGDIENIRGVSADSVLATLVDRRFLVEAGRKDVAGRPILYKTTAEFLEAFGLRSLEALPPAEFRQVESLVGDMGEIPAARYILKGAVQVPGPAMKGAPQAGREPAGVGGFELGSPVEAGVGIGLYLVWGATDDENGVAPDIVGDVVADVRDVLFPTGPLPHLRPEMFHLQLKKVGRGVARVGQVPVAQETVALGDQRLRRPITVGEDQVTGARAGATVVARRQRP